MTEDKKPVDRRGTFWDWPVPIMLLAAVLGFFVLASGGTPNLLLFLIFFAALLAWLARRGVFSPRK